MRQAVNVSENPEPVDVVRAGYDAVSYLYRADDEIPDKYRVWLDKLVGRLPGQSRVLDLGCGCGVPVSRTLTEAGHAVTGIDLSEVQIERARGLVPGATFMRADMTTLDLPAEAFDAIVCLYAVIHVPVEQQLGLLSNVATWLAPEGVLLLVAGWRAWTGSEESWLGGSAPMWWSHADVDTYRSWLADVGLVVESQELVPEGDGGHSLFWARKTS